MTANFQTLFHLDTLATIMVALVGTVGAVVMSFASRYMQGDRMCGRFMISIRALIVTLIVMVAADNIVLFAAAWGISKALLVQLMVHKPEWRAARASGGLAARMFTAGFVFLAGGLFLLSRAAGSLSIQEILNSASANDPWATLGLLMLLLAAMTQSAIFPFHRWLISSLNSPTPVSAIMHAGLVNGGGFLLARFAPLLPAQPELLTVIFIIGIITAIIGTLWKLMQHDIKRMLACSTMSQMGFMLVQCGLGLFPAAIAHLCWHGLFKAYLFLSASSAAQEKRLPALPAPGALTFVLALICGAAGSYTFAWASHKIWFAADSTAVLVAVTFIAAVQLSLAVMQQSPVKNFILAALIPSFAGALYGASVGEFEDLLAPLNILAPQPLNAFHIAAIALLALGWLAMTFGRAWWQIAAPPRWLSKLYVRALNGSQPHAATITAHRNHYSFS